MIIEWLRVPVRLFCTETYRLYPLFAWDYIIDILHHDLFVSARAVIAQILLTIFCLYLLKAELKLFMLLVILIVAPAGWVHALVIVHWYWGHSLYIFNPLLFQSCTTYLALLEKVVGPLEAFVYLMWEGVRLMIHDDAIKCTSAAINILSHVGLRINLLNFLMIY